MPMSDVSYAIVTGAASGMGRFYCRNLSGKGYGVIAVDRDSDGLDSLEREIPDATVVKIVQDLTEVDAAQRIKSVVDEADLTVDILVNNAGMLFTTAMCNTDPARLDAIMRLHCNTPLQLCRAFLPGMQERGRGYVLNVSSICAWMSWPLIGMYGNTKRFVLDYSRSLAIECRGTGVSVTTAVFGAVDTPLFGFPEKMRKLMLGTGFMISPEKAVDKALKAMFKGKRCMIAGFANRLVILIAPMLSDRLLAKLARKYGPVLNKN